MKIEMADEVLTASQRHGLSDRQSTKLAVYRLWKRGGDKVLRARQKRIAPRETYARGAAW